MYSGKIKNRPVVSFCIPTFNRAEKIYTSIINILSYLENDIEVIVLDNCSTDNTKTKLSAVNDTRFFFYENNQNVGGKNNCLKVLTLGSGEYVCLCLDKDSINHNYIKEMIAFLKSNPEIVAGYCSLNENETNESIVYEKGISSIINIAYLSKHPSGNFYRNDLLKKLNIYEKKEYYNSESGFMFEFINAEMSLFGKSAKINLPLISTETKNEASENISHTYSGKNLYFLPEKQYELYELYLNHIAKLKILKRDRMKLAERLFAEKLESATFGYRAICKDNLVCLHYGFKPDKGGFLSILKEDFNFCRKFINAGNYKTTISRFLICLKTNVNMLIKILKMKLKRTLNSI